MQTSYIYSTSRINTVSEELLTMADIDRLLVAKPGGEFTEALKETYLASYLIQAAGDVRVAIRSAEHEAKLLLTQVSPDTSLLKPLWLRYDVHNLRVIAKATVAGVAIEEVDNHFSSLGAYDPAYLQEAVSGNFLNRLEQDWQEAYDEAIRVASGGDLEAVDGIFDELYFATAGRLIAQSRDVFMARYFKAMIDLHNLKSRLRTLTYPNMTFRANFIVGGNYGRSEIDTKEQVLATYAKLGNESHWRDAIEYYTATNNTTRLDARAEDYLVSLTREAAYNMFSSASLVLYYLRSQQSADNIRTILVGLNAGMKQDDIRANLRIAYVN